jgi:tRNA(His) 5'-end guanylyltransferase
MKQSMSHDDLGDRMKMYERQEAGRHFMPRIPIVARLDGRAFHSFTRGLDQPYSNLFMQCMVNTAYALVKQTNATVAYRQSDEITLIWPGQQNLEEFWFGGRVQKMCSMLASIATLEFNLQVREILGHLYAERKPMFDCRVWQVPDELEATNVLVWREKDAVKNSVMAMALSVVGHKAVLNKNHKEQLDLIHGGEQNWNDQPDWAKRGTYVARQRVSKAFTCAELAALPPKHKARTQPELVVDRVELTALNLPRITTISNRVDVIFRGAEPVLFESV